MKKKAFLIALSQKLRDNEILFLDKIVLTQPKTKEAAVIIKNLSNIKNFEKLAGKKKNRAIIAIPQKNEEIKRSFRNIPGLEISEFRNLNVLDLVTYKHLIIANPDEKIFSH